MTLIRSIVAFAIATLAMSLHAKECGQKIRGQRPEQITKALAQRPKEPAFYLRLDNFAVFVSPENLLGHLTGTMRTVHPRLDARILAKVRADMPLRDDGDLFKYVLKDAALYDRLYSITADLLIEGKASVVDVLEEPAGVSLRELRIYRYRTLGDYYEFCTDSNWSFLTFTTVVE